MYKENIICLRVNISTESIRLLYFAVKMIIGGDVNHFLHGKILYRTD